MVEQLSSPRPIIGFLDQLDEAGIPYVSWKNNHELTNALNSERDVDLFIPIEHRTHFMMLRAQDSWLCVANPVARYPWVIHLYKPSEDLHFYHLHVYFKVVTGESWLKEYQLPLDHFLIENRLRSPTEHIWILNRQAQAYLFAIRHLLKGGSMSSRLLYRREFESYRKEWLTCARAPHVFADIGPIRLTTGASDSGLTAQDLAMPGFFAALKFRASLLPLLRIPWWSLSLRRIYSLLNRAMNRYLFKRKKVLPSGGLIIALSGVDGAGKSTMLEEAFRFFSGFLTVKRFGLGRPQGRFIESFRKLVTDSKRSEVNDRASRSGPISIRKSVSAMVLALLRLRNARKAMSYASRGYLVLADRWPTDQLNKMDGPRIPNEPHAGKLQRNCAVVERWAYERMPRADVCFVLKLPLEAALERNRSRLKSDKETDEEIMARFNQNQQFEPLALKIVPFENGGEFAIMRQAFLALMWQEVLAR